ncbi:acetyl-CoA carboxylase biotin carboxylase subunit [Castellaniella sp. GW247-6E4]|uniref:acetyl/propionyl/methylcrotonyl-CoA carboxylase subunit alpha n=1 Tax=Castellaniella sp. GW247-6E4 TaxID=3140380 RepID=UPI0033154BA5
MSKVTNFSKILVANRGEVALRVMRTAKAMGYRTVAVYSDADRMALHATKADQAIVIGAPLPAESYLRIESIIEAARCSGADAVHPGYGFLAENAEFSEACRDAGLVFIGPSPEAIRAMGNKAAAKRLMQAAGVPCIPGYDGEDQRDATLMAAAAQVGFPLMIKATAGGGGRGMRLVSHSELFMDALRGARSEAQSAFGNSEVILERAIMSSRHIEVQILADRYGNVIHLGERDCSVQRRHQKVIEESPSPAVDAGLRERMGAAAVAAASAIQYEGVGTIEFLLDDDGAYYFMEMNTRLQVEHPVTEMITGLDLVALQLEVARGEKLPLRQKDICFHGHAIEVRLCAEDAVLGFVPQSGVMTMWRVPAGIRVEHALTSGAEISPYYDSMLAKLIAYGATREEARRKLLVAIDDLVALGVKTNQGFLASCLSHPQFVAGMASTAFVATHAKSLLERDAQRDTRARALIAALLYATGGSTSGGVRAHTLRPRLPITLHFEYDQHSYVATLLEVGLSRFQIEISDDCFDVEFLELECHGVRFELDGRVEHAVFMRDDDRLLMQYRGIPFDVIDRTYAPAESPDKTIDGKIKALMGGKVVAVHVAVGDLVDSGDPIITVEAMKMQHIHVAPVAGEVSSLNVHPNDQVSTSRVLAEIVAADKTVAMQTT